MQQPVLLSTGIGVLHAVEWAHHVEPCRFSLQATKADEHAECIAAQASAAQHSFVHLVCFATLSTTQVTKQKGMRCPMFEEAICAVCPTEDTRLPGRAVLSPNR